MNYQLSRRYFLRAATAATLTQLLLGCSNSQEIFHILFLENSVPIQLIGDFRKTISPEVKVDFQPQTQLDRIFDALLNLKSTKNLDSNTKNLLDKIFNQSIIYPGVTSLGNFWLSLAIKQNLIQPLSVNSLTNWQKLSASWQKLVRRDEQGNVTVDGKVYGAPYRWGSAVIAYRSDKLNNLGLTITDWQDLWNPKLGDRLSLLDSPREVIGLTLKKLGYSYNTDDLNSIPNLETELSALGRQVKLYSSEHYLEPLVLGDTWVAVAWSTDILPLLKRYPEIEFVIPQSGTSLWTDMWVVPRSTEALAVNEGLTSMVERWIDFCWESRSAKQISLFTDGISPILLSMKSEDIPEDLQDNIFLNSEVLNSERSEFLLPLKPETERQYQDLWIKIRRA